MTTWVCVFKTGGAYTPEYVSRMARAISRWDPCSRLLCLTDYPGPILGAQTTPLVEGLPGWWSKMELYRPGLLDHGQLVIYLDLDTVIWESPSFLKEYDGDCCVLADLYQPERMVGSGVMLWRGPAMRPLWDAFSSDPEGMMERHQHRSDELLLEVLGEEADRVQDLWPGRVVSFKKHCKRADQPPRGSSLICFHGRPRPADLAKDHWAYRAWEGWG